MKWWKVLGTSVVLHTLDVAQDIKYLINFHEEKKFPEYCWGNWDPRSKLYGSMLIRSRRPVCFIDGNFFSFLFYDYFFFFDLTF